jgi:hypothetical protein
LPGGCIAATLTLAANAAETNLWRIRDAGPAAPLSDQFLNAKRTFE